VPIIYEMGPRGGRHYPREPSHPIPVTSQVKITFMHLPGPTYHQISPFHTTTPPWATRGPLLSGAQNLAGAMKLMSPTLQNLREISETRSLLAA